MPRFHIRPQAILDFAFSALKHEKTHFHVRPLEVQYCNAKTQYKSGTIRNFLPCPLITFTTDGPILGQRGEWPTFVLIFINIFVFILCPPPLTSNPGSIPDLHNFFKNPPILPFYLTTKQNPFLENHHVAGLTLLVHFSFMFSCVFLCIFHLVHFHHNATSSDLVRWAATVVDEKLGMSEN